MKKVMLPFFVSLLLIVSSFKKSIPVDHIPTIVKTINGEAKDVLEKDSVISRASFLFVAASIGVNIAGESAGSVAVSV